MPSHPSPSSPFETSPTFWPDIDVYFKRDLSQAFELIDTLAHMGVRVVKTAALHDPKCCLPSDSDTSYYVNGKGVVSEPYHQVIERHLVSPDQLRQIFAHIRDRGCDLVVSVYDLPGLRLALDFDAVAIKIPSSNIVHAPLIRQVASTGKPVVLDTGRSRLQEIDRAVSWAKAAGAKNLLIQHSPPGLPAPENLHHLAMMREFGVRFGTAYGLSDHHPDISAIPLAVALGARVIEKGVCADNTSPDIDIAHALPISRVPEVLEIMRRAHALTGTADISYRETLSRPTDRMGFVASRDLTPGDIINEETVRFAFPTLGIPVEEWDTFLGATVRTHVALGCPIHHQDIASLEP